MPVTRTLALRQTGGPVGVTAKSMVLAAGLVFAAGTAQAQTAYAPGQPGPGGPNSIAIPVQVTASVGGRCGFADGGAPSGSHHQPDFDVQGFSHDFAFVLDCTGPSRVAVVSSNGGLLTEGVATDGYAVKAPYDVTLHMVADGGAPSVSATCPAETLTPGSTCSDFLGPASASQGLRLAAASTNQSGSYLRVSAPAYAGSATLVAGHYADTLTVTLSASP